MRSGVAAAIAWLLGVGTFASAAAPGVGGDVARAQVLENGLTVVTHLSEATKVVAVEVLVKASAVDEPPGKEGLRQLLQQTLVRGSENVSGDELARELDELGADFDVGLGLDYVEMYVVCLGRDLERGLELVAEVVRRPRFASREVEGQRRTALRHLQALRTAPFELAQHLVRQGLYEGHPYALPPQGTEESLESITRRDLVEFHRRYYVPNNTIVAIAGGGCAANALAAVRRHFGDWARAAAPPRQAPPVPTLARSTLNLREAPVGEAYFMLGFTVGATQPDTYPVMEVVRAVLGRGMGSRFFRALRARAPAAYEADAHYFALTHGGYIAAYVAAEPRDLERVKELIVAEFTRLRDESVSPAELRRAQEFAIGTNALAHARAKDRAFHLAWYEAIGLGWDFGRRYAEAIKSVTAAEVKATARAQFGRYCLGLVLPASQVHTCDDAAVVSKWRQSRKGLRLACAEHKA